MASLHVEVPLEIPHEHKKKAFALRDSISNAIQKAAPEYEYDINIEYGYAE